MPRPSIVLDATDNVTLSQLERFEALLNDDQWQEAVEVLRQIMDEPGGRMIGVSSNDRTTPPRFPRYVSLNRYCQMKLVGLSRSAPEALAFYRSQVNPTAQRLFDRAIADDNESALRRLADRMFASSYGDDALLRLGEFALQRGDWTAARDAWQRISPLLRFPVQRDPAMRPFAGYPSWLLTRHLESDDQWREVEPLLKTTAAKSPWLAYPDTDLDLAGVHARLVLVSTFEGNQVRARAELEILKRLWPNSRGRIGRREGVYCELLREMLEESQQWPPLAVADSWSTFGGNTPRSRSAERGVDIAGAPTWQVELPLRSGNGEYFGDEGHRVGESATGLLSYHPIVVKETVVLQTGFGERDFIARRLHDGKMVFGDNPNSNSTDEVSEHSQVTGVPRFTTTAIGNRLYARVGSATTGNRLDDERADEDAPRIVAVDLAAQGKLVFDLELDKSLWGPNWSFSGVPVGDGRFLYVALRKRGSVRAESHVACFDARDGRVLWRRMLVGAETPSDRPLEVTHTLLTLRGQSLYCNTNLGVVAALRTDDGSVQWLTQYPRVDFQNEDPDRNTRHYFRDLNPCLLQGDLAIVAPMDCDRLFALDAITGQKIWETRAEQAADAIHLLGVGDGNLMASGDYLYWFDVYSGQLVAQFPPPGKSTPGHARPTPRGYGRGILAGKHVYWPTLASIFVFEHRTIKTEIGREPVLVREIELIPRGATGGNLVIADGVLLIATPDRLFAFDEYGKQSGVTE
jgi:outer membrane protein assembly factor BamB